jgi:hypothetical protein
VNVTGVVLVLLALVVVAVMAYRAGYVRGQDELLQWHRSTAAERNALRMTAVLPRWRRLTGWAAYGFAGLLNCLFLALAFLYAKRWGWAVVLAAWVLWVRPLRGSDLACRVVLAALPRGSRTAAAETDRDTESTRRARR